MCRSHLASRIDADAAGDILQELNACRDVEIAYPETTPVDAALAPRMPVALLAVLLTTPAATCRATSTIRLTVWTA